MWQSCELTFSYIHKWFFSLGPTGKSMMEWILYWLHFSAFFSTVCLGALWVCFACHIWLSLLLGWVHSKGLIRYSCTQISDWTIHTFSWRYSDMSNFQFRFNMWSIILDFGRYRLFIIIILVFVILIFIFIFYWFKKNLLVSNI